MANESNFSGQVSFYHRHLKNNEENREKFKIMIETLLEKYDGYYGNFELDSSEIDLNEDSEYLESYSIYFWSIGKWAYANTVPHVLTLNSEGIPKDIFSSYIGFGAEISGTDFEMGNRVLEEIEAKVEVIGTKEVKDNGKNDVFTLSEVVLLNEKTLEYNTENINYHEGYDRFYNLHSVYGLKLLFDLMEKRVKIRDNYSIIRRRIEKLMPNTFDFIKNNFIFKCHENQIMENLFSIILFNFLKYEVPQYDLELEEIYFEISPDTKDKLTLFHSYDDFNMPLDDLFKDIEKDFNRYIGVKKDA